MSDSLRDALRAYNVTVQEASEGMARAARLIAAAVRGEREDEPMTDQPDLVAWLRAQLDEDERVARAVRDASWRETLNLDKPGWNEFDQTEIDHIVRHDPARVLAEVTAKRRIIEVAVGAIESARPLTGDRILRLLAQPYAGKEGFREEWRV